MSVQPIRPSEREMQVLVLLAGGKTVPQIARCLDLSEHTVGEYLKRLRRRFELATQAGLVGRAFALGLIDVGVWPPAAAFDDGLNTGADTDAGSLENAVEFS